MIQQDKNALICDFAETYHIYDYRSLPLSLASTLAAGLRDNSRVAMSTTDVKASTTNTILSIIADRLGVIQAVLCDERKAPPSIFRALYNLDEEESSSKVKRFQNGEDFLSMWNKINEE